jgi:hypothetical protein
MKECGNLKSKRQEYKAGNDEILATLEYFQLLIILQKKRV